MANIAIDLLPKEFRVEEIKRAKFVKVQIIGLGVILFIIFISSLIVALRILQSQRIAQINAKLTLLEKRVTDQKETQSALVLLKNRLNAIANYLGVPSRQAQMHKLVEGLLPSSVSLNTISVGRGGEILILGTTPSGDSVDELLNNLITKDSNEDKVQSVSMESLSRGKDGIFRINFKVLPKK